MSVVNEFEASAVLTSSQEKAVYIVTPEGGRFTFPFSFKCKNEELSALFDMSNMRMMVIVPSGASSSPLYRCKYLCTVMKFFIDNDLPIPAVRYWQDPMYLAVRIGFQFQDKLASYTLDSIINS